MALIEFSYKSRAISKSTHITIILPCDDEIPAAFSKPFKTMYFLSHFTGNTEVLKDYINFRTLSSLYGFAFVLIGGDNAFYVDKGEILSNYSTYIQEIVELTRMYFPFLSRKKEETYIAGASMGGYGAIYNGIRFYNLFGGIAALSALTDPYLAIDHEIGFTESQIESFFPSRENYVGSDYDLKRKIFESLRNGTLPKIFMCCGKCDSIVGYECIPFLQQMSEKKIPGKFIVNEGAHDVIYWNKMMIPVLEFLKE